MYTIASTTEQIATISVNTGTIIAVVIGGVLITFVALLGLGLSARSIKDIMEDRSIRLFGYYLRDKPYASYNRWRSQKWNMEHTA